MELELLKIADAVGISAAKAGPWLIPVMAAFKYADIDTRERAAAFLAQVGHESGSFRYVREIWGPTPAQSRYEGRADLGNTHSGDGKRYMGRGLIQITGRANYARVSKRLMPLGAPDFESRPDLLESPRWAAISAADYWLDRKLNQFCNPGAVQFIALTKKINGGTNGLADRLARYDRAFAALGVGRV